MERPRGLGRYLGALMRAGTPGAPPPTENWSDDGSFQKAVDSIGYTSFAEFIGGLCPGACDASGACKSTCDQVYLPEGIASAAGRDKMTLEQLAAAEAAGLQFWGMSGGGGSGAGFEIMCGPDETIITGGGGGGGGATSPEEATAVQAGGGGGGGPPPGGGARRGGGGGGGGGGGLRSGPPALLWLAPAQATTQRACWT